MTNIYYYLYISIYRLWKKMPGRDHAFLAMAALSLLILYNVLSMIIFLKLFAGFTYQQVKVPVIVGVFLFLIVNYFIFIFNHRYLKIEQIFVPETKKQKRNRSIAVIAYVILTFVFLFLVLFS